MDIAKMKAGLREQPELFGTVVVSLIAACFFGVYGVHYSTLGAEQSFMLGFGIGGVAGISVIGVAWWYVSILPSAGTGDIDG